MIETLTSRCTNKDFKHFCSILKDQGYTEIANSLTAPPKVTKRTSSDKMFTGKINTVTLKSKSNISVSKIEVLWTIDFPDKFVQPTYSEKKFRFIEPKSKILFVNEFRYTGLKFLKLTYLSIK